MRAPTSENAARSKARGTRWALPIIIAWIALIALSVVVGLGSRRYGEHLPEFLARYAGDTLWALVAFLGIGLLRPRASTAHVALLAFAFSALVETSQLYHAPWIDLIRRTTLGALVLGDSFVWSDIACYAAGVALGCMIDVLCLRQVSGRGE